MMELILGVYFGLGVVVYMLTCYKDYMEAGYAAWDMWLEISLPVVFLWPWILYTVWSDHD